jgi:hypothetical protein
VTPKEINRASGKIFAQSIPNNWAIRNQEDQEDYGIDYELELIAENDQPTGFIFKVQQKGVEAATIINNGTIISFSDLPIGKIHYYLRQIRLPVVLVVVDLKSKLSYWTMLQANVRVQEAYEVAVAAGQKTMTVHLPVTNVLPTTFDRLLEAVQETNNWLMVQSIKKAPSPELLAAAVLDSNFDATVKAFSLHHDTFRCEQIERLLREQRYDLAFQTAETIFNSPAESASMRFAAALNLIRIQPVLSVIRGDPQRDQNITAARLSVTATLFKITKSNGEEERRLRLYALFLHRAARLRELVQRDLGFFLSVTAQRESGNVLTLAMTNAARAPIANAIIRELRRLERHFLWMIRRGQFYFFAPAWAQLVADVTPFVTRLRHEKIEELATPLVEWLDNTGTIAIDISTRLENWSDVIECAFQGIALSTSLNDEEALDKSFARARAIVESIPEEIVRERGVKDLTAHREEFRKGTSDFEYEAQMYRNMASAMGVDLSDETDRIAGIINVGIRDLNPERVLKNCRYLFVTLGGGGIPAQMLGLPTAGWKTVRCTKFGYEVGTMALDNAYGSMYEMHCEKCMSCEPHPKDWKWSREWQEQQHAEFGDSEKTD